MKIKLDLLDKLFSEYIRKRSKGYCQRCGRFYGNWKQLQTSHFYGRSRKSVRWDEDNAVALCFGCHQYFTSHPLEHTEWFTAHLGEHEFQELSHRARQIGKPDKLLLEIFYKQKIAELERIE